MTFISMESAWSTNFYMFGKTVNLSFDGLTGINSSGHFQAENLPKVGDFYVI